MDWTKDADARRCQDAAADTNRLGGKFTKLSKMTSRVTELS